MRALLPVLLLAATTSLAHAEQPSLSFDKVEVSGKVDKKSVSAALKKSSNKLLACYRVLAPDVVVATFSIEGTGIVATAAAPSDSDRLSKCITDVLAKIAFAKPKDGLPAGISVHIRYDSGGGPATADTTGHSGLGYSYSGDGTIGLGTIGTSGYSGSGTGYGSGFGRLPPKKSPVTLGTAKVRGDLDPTIVRRYVMRYQNRLGFCYEKEQLATPTLAGKLTVDFTIGADGKVSTATAKGVHANLETCVANAIKAIEFPKPKTPGDVTVSYPLTFKPPTK